MEWTNQDPRELIGKRANIVVWAPQGEVFRAEVETHQGWCVFLRNRGKDQRSLVSESDSWPPEWKWIQGP